MRKKLVIISLGLVAGSLFAQGPGRHMGDFALVRAEFGTSNKVVQGAPYSAQAVTQFTQTLANGDHVQRTTTASIARDSPRGGRAWTVHSRRLALFPATAGGQARAIMIHDPVAGVSYSLNPAAQDWHLHADSNASGVFRGSHRAAVGLQGGGEDPEGSESTQVIQGRHRRLEGRRPLGASLGRRRTRSNLHGGASLGRPVERITDAGDRIVNHNGARLPAGRRRKERQPPRVNGPRASAPAAVTGNGCCRRPLNMIAIRQGLRELRHPLRRIWRALHYFIGCSKLRAHQREVAQCAGPALDNKQSFQLPIPKR